ncbi:MAG: haloacid dehalogenase-like hydrolase [Bacteroidales bacterium]
MSDKIAIVFDFDDTLAPDTTSGLLRMLGLEPEKFWKEEVDPLLQMDWDPVPAYLYALWHCSDSGSCEPITREIFVRAGLQAAIYPGVERLLTDLQELVKATDARFSLEYYVVSSGIGEILRNTSLAGRFTDLWASEFHYDAAGKILFPRKVISFTDKTRYLFQISKGICGPESRRDPFEVNKRVHEDHLRIPLSNFIYLGDGYTDIPCFSLLRKNGGIPIAVYDKNNRLKKEKAWKFVKDQRVMNLHSADYSPDSDLCNTLEMAVKDIMSR